MCGGLVSVLAPDARLVSDSGGAAKAPRRVVVGADRISRISRFLAAVAPEGMRDPALGVRFLELNGAPAVLLTVDGRPDTVFSLEVAGGQVRTVHLIRNPAKLAHLAGAGERSGLTGRLRL